MNIMHTEVNIVWKSFVNLKENTQWRYLMLKRKKLSCYQMNSRNYMKMKNAAILFAETFED